MFYGFIVQGIACKPVGDVLHLPAALEGGIHGEYVLVGGIHGGDDGEVRGKFYRTKFVFMHFISNIAVIDSVFTAAIVISVKQLEDFTEDCRCVATIQFLDNKQAFFLMICVGNLQNACKRTGNELILQFFFFRAVTLGYCFKYRHYLTNKVGISVVRMKNNTHFTLFISYLAFVSFLYRIAFATTGNTVKQNIFRKKCKIIRHLCFNQIRI